MPGSLPRLLEAFLLPLPPERFLGLALIITAYLLRSLLLHAGANR